MIKTNPTYRLQHIANFYAKTAPTPATIAKSLIKQFPQVIGDNFISNLENNHDGIILESITTAAEAIDSRPKAKVLLNFMESWNPFFLFNPLTPIKDLCRSAIFQNPNDQVYSESFIGSATTFSLTDKAGKEYLAGITSIGYGKTYANEDAMAIATATDGTVYTAVADGVGSCHQSQIASETYANVVVTEMAHGISFRDACISAANHLRKNKKEILVLELNQIIKKYIHNKFEQSIDSLKKLTILDELFTLIEEKVDCDTNLKLKIHQILNSFLKPHTSKGITDLTTVHSQLPILFTHLLPLLDYMKNHDTAFIFVRGIKTTLVVTAKRKIQQQTDSGTVERTQIRIYRIGDSGAALFQKIIGKHKLISQTRPNSRVQTMLDNSSFDDIVRTILRTRGQDPDLWSAGEIRKYAEFLSRNHPASNIVIEPVSPNDRDFLFTHRYDAITSDTDWITLDPNQSYVLIRYTDRLSDSGSLKDFAKDLDGDIPPAQMIKNILAHIQHNNTVMNIQKSSKFKFANDKLRELIASKISDSFFGFMRSKLRMSFDSFKDHLENMGVDRSLIDNYLVPHTIGSNISYPPYFAIDGGNFDDTTVIVGVIET